VFEGVIHFLVDDLLRTQGECGLEARVARQVGSGSKRTFLSKVTAIIR
jgi:hypothetical protein